MDLPWWGWLLVPLWLLGGVAGFGVFLRRFESAAGVRYYLVGDEDFRAVRTFIRALPLVTIFLFLLVFGPLGLLAEVQSQRGEKQKVQRMRLLREQRRERREKERQQGATERGGDAPTDSGGHSAR